MPIISRPNTTQLIKERQQDGLFMAQTRYSAS